MPFCKKCGNKLDDQTAFCPKCGTANEWAGSVNNSGEYAKREQTFVGKVRKCPQCGSVLSSDAVVCSECGHELGVDSISQELKDFKDNIGRLETYALTNEKVAILLKSTITNFSVPHTKGDLRDLLVFVSSKVKNETTDAEWFNIWYAKLKQIVDEANILFSNDKDFLTPFVKQKEQCDIIAVNRRESDLEFLKNKNKKKMSLGMKIGIIIALLFLPIFVKSCNQAMAEMEAKSNARIKKIQSWLYEKPYKEIAYNMGFGYKVDFSVAYNIKE